MRDFDYSSLKNKTWDSEIISLVVVSQNICQ